MDDPPRGEPEEELAEMMSDYRQQKNNGGSSNPYDSKNNPYIAGLVDGEFTMHFTSSWKDIQAKAKRIREDGHVRIISSTPAFIVGEVRGDTNIYQATLMREGNSKKIALWECGCAWASTRTAPSRPRTSAS